MKKITPEELIHAIQGQLYTGENILWTTQPAVEKYIKRTTLNTNLLAIAFMVVAFFLISPLLRGLAVEDVYWGISAICAVMAVIFLTVPMRIRKSAKATMYAVTDERAVILSMDGEVVFHFVTMERLQYRRKIIHPDGSADIVLDEVEKFSVSRTGQQSKRSEPVSFIALPSIEEVEKVIKDALKAKGLIYDND